MEKRPKVTHRFRGLDPFLSAWLGTCDCGWSSQLHPSQEHAVAAYARHRVGVFVTTLRNRSRGVSGRPPTSSSAECRGR